MSDKKNLELIINEIKTTYLIKLKKIKSKKLTLLKNFEKKLISKKIAKLKKDIGIID